MKGLVKPRTYGRMGNFLFQAAAAAGYAWRHGMDFTLPNSTTNLRWNPIYLQHLVRKDWEPSLPIVEVKEKTHGYQLLPFAEFWRERNVILDGYWQSEKYFKEFRDRILEAFDFKWSRMPGRVSVHVRRTDYLQLPQKHPPVTKEWIEAAMSIFPGAHFLFFSDDIHWCQGTFGHRKDCFFSIGHSEIDDLTRMSWCEHHICSASTFAWWGAWLNRSTKKRVIFPKLWFTPGYNKTDTKDIVPAEWERL
jgi:hypothetical protein